MLRDEPVADDALDLVQITNTGERNTSSRSETQLRVDYYQTTLVGCSLETDRRKSGSVGDQQTDGLIGVH